MADAVGESDFLRWIVYYHEKQEAHVRARARVCV